MKRLTILSISAALSLFMLGSAAAQQTLKVGIVDMARVFGEYYKTKDIEQELEEHRKAAGKEVEERGKGLKDADAKLKELYNSINDPAVGQAK